MSGAPKNGNHKYSVSIFGYLWANFLSLWVPLEPLYWHPTLEDQGETDKHPTSPHLVHSLGSELGQNSKYQHECGAQKTKKPKIWLKCTKNNPPRHDKSSEWIRHEACSSVFALKNAATLDAFVFLCFAVMLFARLRPHASAHPRTHPRPVRGPQSVDFDFVCFWYRCAASWWVED